MTFLSRCIRVLTEMGGSHCHIIETLNGAVKHTCLAGYASMLHMHVLQLLEDQFTPMSFEEEQTSSQEKLLVVM